MRQDEFWDHVDVREPDECWEWTGRRDAKGYGVLHLNGHKRPYSAHRVAYALRHGGFPHGQVNHTCDNRVCCNDHHLYEGTQRDNVHDMMRRGRLRPWKAGMSHCFRGHEFTPENTVWNKRGNRQCRICYQLTTATYDARRKAGVPIVPHQKLTAAIVRVIRERHTLNGTSQRALAAEFGLSRGTIARALGLRGSLENVS